MGKGTITVYADPQNRDQVITEIKTITGIDIDFPSDQYRFLSWIGEASIDISSQADAFKLERDLLKNQNISDVEITTDESQQEEELNFQLDYTNEAINSGKTVYPNPNWYHDAIEIKAALEYAEQSFNSNKGFFNKQSSRINVGLIDTGYTRHPEVLRFDLSKGRSFMPGESFNNPLDTLESTRPIPIRWGGHGTSCAGIIIGQNAIIPHENQVPKKNVLFNDLVNGLLPENINLIPYRVSKNIISFSSRMATAIKHIIDDGTIGVISMSHASLSNKRIYYAAVREAYEKGIIIVAAPGSHVFGSPKVYTYPAKYPETIAPAASTVNNVPWKLTHGGEEVDLCAPGFEIYIPTSYNTNTGVTGYGYKWSEGSSFAVPIVATAAALWKMHHGNKLNAFSPTQRIELFRNIIKKTSTPFSSPNIPPIYGTGVINFKRMLEYPIDGTSSHKIAKNIENPIAPKELYTTNKSEVSLIRELTFLKQQQLLINKTKSINEIDFYIQNGTDDFKEWLQKKTKNESDKIQYMDKILESNL